MTTGLHFWDNLVIYIHKKQLSAKESLHHMQFFGSHTPIDGAHPQQAQVLPQEPQSLLSTCRWIMVAPSTAKSFPAPPQGGNKKIHRISLLVEK